MPETCFGGPWSEAALEYERKLPRLTYFTFLYDIAALVSSDEVPDKHVGILLTSFDDQRLADIAADPMIFGEEGSVFAKMVLADHGVHGVLNESKPQSSCPDCEDGFYTPFVGPREKCQTCNGTTLVDDISKVKPSDEAPRTGILWTNGGESPWTDCRVESGIEHKKREDDRRGYNTVERWWD